MSIKIKRVPLDFDWPIGKIWPGYMFSLCINMDYVEKQYERCNLCRHYAKIMKYPISDYGCPELPFRDPPKGKGYQLWEMKSGGSPKSPVFDTPEKLATFLADNKISSFGNFTENYETWLKFIKDVQFSVSAVIEISLDDLLKGKA